MEDDSQYAYFLCEVGLFRVKIPDFDDSTAKHKFKMEWAFYNPSKPLPSLMALVSYDRDVYMIGGHEGNNKLNTDRIYMFSTKRYSFNPLCPFVDRDRLEKPELCDNFQPMASPCAIRAKNDKVYFLSEYDFFRVGNNVGREYKPFCFQSFNPAKNRFKSLPSPPYIVADSGIVPYKGLGYFYVGGYVYLFVTETVNSNDCVRVFTFNPRLLKWKERKKMAARFDEMEIPIPRLHSGDVGLSHEFSDGTHVMVALHGGLPTAYRVCLRAGGSIHPKSYRILTEVDVVDCRGSAANQRSHLFDIRGGRFCVIYHSDYVSLHIYAFKIDFALEHRTQRSDSYYKPRSSQILSSKKFQDPIPWFNNSRISAVCLADMEEKKKKKKTTKEDEINSCKWERGEEEDEKDKCCKWCGALYAS